MKKEARCLYSSTLKYGRSIAAKGNASYMQVIKVSDSIMRKPPSLAKVFFSHLKSCSSPLSLRLP